MAESAPLVKERLAHAEENRSWSAHRLRMQQKNARQSEELRRNRASLKKLEAALEKAQKQIESAKKQRDLASAKADEWRSYSMTLESKISVGSSFNSLTPQTRLLRHRIHELENTANELTAIKAAMQSELTQKDKELRVLARALELHAEELGIRVSDSTDKNRKGKLLRAVAEARDECQGLAVELGVRIQERDVLEAEAETLRRELEDKNAQLARSAEALKALKESRKQVEDAQERAAQVERALALDKEKLQSQLNVAMREATLSREAAAASEKALKLHSEKIEEEKSKLRKTLEEATTRAARIEEKRASTATVAEVLQRQLMELSNEKKALDAEFGSRGKLVEKLSSRVRSLERIESEAVQLRRDIEIEKARAARAKSSEKAAVEEVAAATADLKKACEERDAALQALQQAVNYGAQQSMETEKLEKSRTLAQEELEKSRDSKAVLQRALLDQLGELRAALSEERAARLEAEAARDSAIALGAPHAVHFGDRAAENGDGVVGKDVVDSLDHDESLDISLEDLAEPNR